MCLTCQLFLMPRSRMPFGRGTAGTELQNIGTMLACCASRSISSTQVFARECHASMSGLLRQVLSNYINIYITYIYIYIPILATAKCPQDTSDCVYIMLNTTEKAGRKHVLGSIANHVQNEVGAHPKRGRPMTSSITSPCNTRPFNHAVNNWRSSHSPFE